ncbi:manganese transport protein [Burkholderia sp. b13]|nr:manganese transport protein [Burkholderia sp. b13]
MGMCKFMAISSEQTAQQVRQVLDGRRRGVRILLPLAGPAVVVSVAYMDPGNFATNIQAGAGYGYQLLWVVLFASLVAMLFQGLSARLGIVTGCNLAQLCRARLPKPVTLSMWMASELAAMATDLAEFIGGAIGVALLFHIPLLTAMVIVGVLTYLMLMFQRHGFRPLELAIGALVGIIALAYVAQLFIVPIDWRAVGHGALHPSIPDHPALTIAVGIVGATVMPHALFLHSGLTGERVVARSDADRRALLRYSRIEVLVALSVAGLVNMAMVVMAAGAFHPGHAHVAEIDQAYRTLTPLFGAAASALFIVSLIASGLSSSVVGTMAGQMIMQGFVGFRIPVIMRRLVTMLPAFLVVAAGVDATRALIISQVVLSLTVPVPMIALVWLCRHRDVMGGYRLSPWLAVLSMVAAVLVIGLNVALIVDTLC